MAKLTVSADLPAVPGDVTISNPAVLSALVRKLEASARARNAPGHAVAFLAEEPDPAELAFTGVPAADGTVTLAGVVLTAKASPEGVAEFARGGSATEAATNVTAAINAHPVLSHLVVAASDAGDVSIVSKVPFVLGFAEDLTNCTGTPFVLAAGAKASSVRL